MERRLRILHFEDSKQDAELIRENLAAGGIQCDISLVQNNTDFVKAFDDQWDLILSDFNVPGFDGLAALDAIRKRDPDIPFILISGTIGEELAIESLKSGATDYILKDKLARLVPAVQRALQEAEEREQRLLSEKALVKSEERYRTLVSSMQEGLLEADNDDIIQFVNDRLCVMLGYQREDLLGQVVYRLLASNGNEAQIVEKNLQPGRGISEQHEIRCLHKDGHSIWMEIGASPIVDARGAVIGSVATFSDVTMRKRAEEEILRRDRLLSALVEIADKFLSVSRLEDELALVVEALGKAAEVSRAYMFQNHPGPDGSLRTSQRSEWTATRIDSQIGNERLQNFDYARNGFGRWVEVLDGKGVISGSVQDFPQREREILAAQRIQSILVVPIFTNQGWWGFIGFDDCIGERVWSGSERSVLETAADLIGAAIDRQRSSREIERQAKMLDATTDAVIVEDIQGNVIYHNPAAVALYGSNAEEFQNLNGRQTVFGRVDTFDKLKQELLQKGYWSGESENKTKDGKRVIVESRVVLVKNEKGNPEYVLNVNRDITEKKLLQEQFLRAQRLEGIGTLAGGIAHDLNNVLGPILLSLEVMRSKVEDPGLLRMIDTIESSGRRGADLIKQVLSFARGVQGQYVTVQIRHLVGEIESIMRETFSKSITVATKAPKNLWTVSGDATQLHQVLMNLCVNARDAMPDGGRLEVKCENIELDEQYVAMHLEAKLGRYVCLSVTDTGIGILPEIKAKIFDPFYTTKEIGKGTGLGLSTVLTIVKSHGGFINVYSELGKGATFRVYLAARASDVPALLKEREDSVSGNGELILVVDDEEAIREITRTTLEAFGYAVVTASDGTEAVSKYALEKDRIALVVTDMMMPYMDGPATIRALRRMNPNVRILAVSGLTPNGQVTEEATGVAFLHKPYTAQKLLESIRTVLDSK